MTCPAYPKFSSKNFSQFKIGWQKIFRYFSFQTTLSIFTWSWPYHSLPHFSLSQIWCCIDCTVLKKLNKLLMTFPQKLVGSIIYSANLGFYQAEEPFWHLFIKFTDHWAGHIEFVAGRDWLFAASYRFFRTFGPSTGK